MPAGKDGQDSRLGGFRIRLRLLKPNEPLWLPKGSIRALIVLVVLATVLWMQAAGMQVDDRLWSLAGMLVSFYFGSRLQFKENQGK